jgi:hypothetical protein
MFGLLHYTASIGALDYSAKELNQFSLQNKAGYAMRSG